VVLLFAFVLHFLYFIRYRFNHDVLYKHSPKSPSIKYARSLDKETSMYVPKNRQFIKETILKQFRSTIPSGEE